MDDSDAMAACAAIADRMERLGYLDDRQYAAMRGRAMTRRGLGVRRVKAQLYAHGIAEQDRGGGIEAAEGGAQSAAGGVREEEQTSELQSQMGRPQSVSRLEKKRTTIKSIQYR